MITIIALICFKTITDTTENHYEGIIDSGRELALMFDILKDQTGKMNQVIAGFFTSCFNIVQCSTTHFWLSSCWCGEDLRCLHRVIIYGVPRASVMS